MSDRETPLRRLLRWSLVAVSLLWFFLNILPFTPTIETGADRGTWRLVLNVAFSQGRQFGTEVLFTYGPWGFVGTQHYTPSTYPPLLISWIFLAVAMAIGVWKLVGSTVASPMRQAVTYSLFLFLISITPIGTTDVFFFLLAFVLLLVSETPHRFTLSQIMLAVGLALASLAKFSCLMAALPVLAVTLIEDVRHRRAPVAPISFAIGYFTFWLAAHQRLATLGTFLRRSFEVASGYSEAMALTLTSSAEHETALTMFSMATLLGLFAASAWQKRAGLMRVLAVAAILFVNFKAGFVREDGHVVITTATLMVMAALCVPRFWRESRMHRIATISMCVASTACFCFALLHYTFGGLLYTVEEMFRRLPVASSFLTRPHLASEQLRKSYEAGLVTIRKRAPLARIDGTVDIYPWHQSVPIAYGFNYTPRPVFESYSAYSPLLARLNADHLAGASAPQTILFDVGTIDDRYPSLDDGVSWPLLLSNYDVVREGPTFLTLSRRALPKRVDNVSLTSTAAQLGQDVTIPSAAGAVWCQIDIQPSLAGRLITILLRQPALILRATLSGGQTREYRLVPSMARAGFLLSPLVDSTSSFAALARGSTPPPLMITKINIRPANSGDSRWFHSEYQIRLSQLRVDPGAAIASVISDASRISRDRLR